MSDTNGLSGLIISIATILLSFGVYFFNLKKDKNANDVILVNELSKTAPNKYLVEKTFRNIYHCGYTSFEEIEILYNHSNPLVAIKLFIRIRFFNKAFTLSKKDGGGITAEFTEAFSTTRKRTIMFFASTTVLIGIYFLNLYLIINAINSYVKISTSISNHSMMEKILISPDPIFFLVLFILTSILLFFILMYTMTILMAKHTMSQLVQSNNLKNIRKYSISKIIKILIKKHTQKMLFFIKYHIPR